MCRAACCPKNGLLSIYVLHATTPRSCLRHDSSTYLRHEAASFSEVLLSHLGQLCTLSGVLPDMLTKRRRPFASGITSQQAVKKNALECLWCERRATRNMYLAPTGCEAGMPRAVLGHVPICKAPLLDRSKGILYATQCSA